MPNSYTLIDILRSINMTKDELKSSIGVDNDNITDYSYLIHNQKIDVYNTASAYMYDYAFRRINGESGSNPPTPRGGKVAVPGIQYDWDGSYDGDEGLCYLMTVVLNSKLAMRDELWDNPEEDIPNSNIFEYYPYRISYIMDNEKDDGEHYGVEVAYNQIVVPAPAITGTPGGLITIIPNADIQIYYKIDEGGNEIRYTGPFNVNSDCIIYAISKTTIEGIEFKSPWTEMPYTTLATPEFTQLYNSVTITRPSGYGDDYVMYYSVDGVNFNICNNNFEIKINADTNIYAYGTYEDARSVTAVYFATFTPWLYEWDDSFGEYTTYGTASQIHMNKLYAGLSWDDYCNKTPIVKCSSTPYFNPNTYTYRGWNPRFMYKRDGGDWNTLSHSPLDVFWPDVYSVDMGILGVDLDPNTTYTRNVQIAVGGDYLGDDYHVVRNGLGHFEENGMVYTYVVVGYTYTGIYSPITDYTYNYDTTIEYIVNENPLGTYAYSAADLYNWYGESYYPYPYYTIAGYSVGFGYTARIDVNSNPYVGDKDTLFCPFVPGKLPRLYGTGIIYNAYIFIGDSKYSTYELLRGGSNLKRPGSDSTTTLASEHFMIGPLSYTEKSARYAYTNDVVINIPGSYYFDGRKRRCVQPAFSYSFTIPDVSPAF